MCGDICAVTPLRTLLFLCLCIWLFGMDGVFLLHDGIFSIWRVYLEIIYFWCLYVKCPIVGFQAVVPMISGLDLKEMAGLGCRFC